jgi:hypothetical protein
MVIDARKAGAQAKFAGSGGAIVGTCPTEKMPSVITSLQSTGYQVFQPQIKEPQR